MMDLIDRLAEHKTLGAAPREELAWLASHGTLRHLEAEWLTTKGAPVEGLFVVLSGRRHLRRPRRRAAQGHGVAGGDVTGVLPYSRLIASPGDVVAQEPTDVLAVPRGGSPRDDSRVSRGHVDPRAQDARSRPGLHVERPARREDGLARQAVRRTGPRAEQPGIGDRAQRGAARGPPGGRRAGDTRAGRRATDRGPARGHRRRARVLPRRRASRACCRRSSRPNARTPSPTGSTITASTPPSAEPLAETAVTLEALDRIAAAVERTGTRRGAPVGGGRLFGSRPRVGDSGSRDAHLRPGRGHQGIHAHGPGDGRRAGGPDVEPGQHGHRAQVEGAGEIGRRRRRRGARPPARARLRRRAEPDLGESDRQRARCRSRLRPRRGDGEPRAAARRRARRSTTGPASPPRSASASSIRSSPPSRSGQGTGLGLDIVRRLVSHNDGEIEVESRPGRTEFRVSLPLADADGAPEGSREQARPPRRRRRPAGARRGAPRSPRRGTGRPTSVVSATSGEEALATIRELKARGDSLAMVISDQRMPGMPGHRGARAIPRGLPAGAARAADGLLGHRRGHQGHQRGASRSLPRRSRGIRPRNACSRWSTICSTPGRPSICPRRRD